MSLPDTSGDIGVSSCQECPHFSAWCRLPERLSPLCHREPGSGWAWTDGQGASRQLWLGCGGSRGWAAGGAQHGVGVGIGGREKKSKSRVHRGNETSPETASTHHLALMHVTTVPGPVL